jgi:hypothetical protein
LNPRRTAERFSRPLLSCQPCGLVTLRARSRASQGDGYLREAEGRRRERPWRSTAPAHQRDNRS